MKLATCSTDQKRKLFLFREKTLLPSIASIACPNHYKTASARSESEYEQLEKGLIGESIVALASDFETSTGFLLLFDGRIEC